MAVKVKDKNSSKTYILLGPAYGIAQSRTDSILDKTLTNRVKALCVCDKYGQIEWLLADSMTVVSIDGSPPEDYF